MSETWKLRLRPIVRRILRPVLWYALDTHVVQGSAKRLHVGSHSALANTIFNTSSGEIHVGDNCAFGLNVMVLTGRHSFIDGRRAVLSRIDDIDSLGWGGGDLEVPSDGFDIVIGDGCWIASGSIISGGVSIGSHCLIAAGAVVTRSFPEYSVLAGVPAVVIGETHDLA